MYINTNMAAMNAWNKLTANENNLHKSLERLSSGYRINRASDDAAGLAVSQKMSAQIRGINMATRNAQDGVSMVQTAEGAIGNIQDMLQRMRELAVQASSGSLQDSDRAQLNTEFSQLKSEISRTASNTTFNGISLLQSGAFGTTVSGTSLTGLTVDDTAATAGNHTVVISNAGGAATSTATSATAAAATQTATTTNTTANSGYGVNLALSTGESLHVTVATQGQSVTGSQIATAIQAQLTAQGAGNWAGVTATWNAGTGNIDLTNNSAGGGSLTVEDGFNTGATDNTNASNKIFGTTTGADATTVANTASASKAAATFTAFSNDTTANSGYKLMLTVDGKAAVAAFTAAAGQTFTAQDVINGVNNANLGVTASLDGTNHLVIKSNAIGATHTISAAETYTNGTTPAANIFSLGASTGAADITGSIDGTTITTADWSTKGVLTVAPGVTATVSGTGTTTVDVVSKALKVQVGANAGETIDVGLAAMTNDKLGITNLSIATLSGMNLSTTDNTNVLNGLDNSLDIVNKARASMGATQNRLETAISNLQTMSQNLTSANSRIMDVDMAAEMSNFTKYQVLQQASTAMLGQANQLPQSILSLLRG